MTEAVKNFLEVNYELLDTDQNEFVHWAYNGLNRFQQKELMSVLKDSDINIDSAVEAFVRFHIAMTLEDLDRPVHLDMLIAQYFMGIFGLDHEWFFRYILNNEQEWDNKIRFSHGKYMVFPV